MKNANLKLRGWLVLQFIILIALVAVTYWFSNIAGAVTGTMAVLCSFFFSAQHFRQRKVVTTLAFIAVGASIMICMLLPIWGGHHGWRDYHSHYIWDAGHIH